MEVIHEAPTISSFTPLSQHQSQTPESFYSGPPVLHHHSANAQLVILGSELRSSPALSRFADQATTNGSTTNGDLEDHNQEVVLHGIDIWVTSDDFLLYSTSKNVGVSIPYPSISLHAIQRLSLPLNSTNEEIQGLFMQVTTSDGFDDHDPDDTISMTLIPSPSCITPTEQEQDQPLDITSPEHKDTTPPPSTSPPQTLYSAVSACANLHPDPQSPSSDVEDIPYFDHDSTTFTNMNEGLPPPMPGSGGWITAENMGEFFDEEGNWRGGGLGPGAGIVRGRGEDEREAEEGDEVIGDIDGEAEGDESKWRRTG